MGNNKGHTLKVAMQGTNTREESSATASSKGLVWRWVASKFTKVLQPDSMSHSLSLESEPESFQHLMRHAREVED